MFGFFFDTIKEADARFEAGQGKASTVTVATAAQTVSGWYDEHYRGLLIRYQTRYERDRGRVVVDYLMSKEPWRTDAKQLKCIWMKEGLNCTPSRPTVKGVVGYHDDGHIYIRADGPHIKDTAAHELGHRICGPSESAADRYAGVRHDWSKWAGHPYAVP